MTRVLIWLLFVSIFARSAYADPLSEAVRAMSASATVANRAELAVHLSAGGHWTFANRSGERFTASGQVEIRRAIARLAPEASTPERTLGFTLSPETFHAGHKALEELPQAAQFRALIDGALVDVERRSNQPLLANIHPTVALAAVDPIAFADALAHLKRPLGSADLRVISFVTSGPRALASTARVDPQSRKRLVDQIDPDHAATAIAGARGAVLVISGKIDGRGLLVRAGDSEILLPMTNLMTAARHADARLIILHTPTSTQLGSRNLLWLPVEIPGLDSVGERATLADVLSLIAGKEPLKVFAVMSDERVIITAQPHTPAWRFDGARWAVTLSNAALDLVGRSSVRNMTVSLPVAARQTELDRRLIKSVPSWLQFSYAALLLLGLTGAPTAWQLFARLWPQEQASEYAHPAGFHAARAVRATLFAVVFMPLAAMVAAPAQLLRLVRRSA